MYHYDHIKEWAQEREHDPANITLLCPGHHDAKTRRRLSVDAVIRANGDPFNANKEHTGRERISWADGPPVVRIGDVRYQHNGPFFPLLIDGIAPIKVYPAEDGAVLFDATFMDEYNCVALEIIQNEVSVSTGLWDVTWVADTLTIADSHRDLLLAMKMDVGRNEFVLKAGRILNNGVVINITDSGFVIPGGRYVDIGRSNFDMPVGLQIGEPAPGLPSPPPLFCLNVNRYGSRAPSE